MSEAIDKVELNEEQIKAREKLVELAIDKINSYGLTWTIQSIEYIVNKENVTFNQLRSCTFKNADGDVCYDLIRAVRLIIQAGLVGSKQISENNMEMLKNKAYEIIEDWRNDFGYIGTLQILLIDIMEKKHFFMGTQDIAVLEILNLKNSQGDLANIMMAMDLEEKINQARAMQ